MNKKDKKKIIESIREMRAKLKAETGIETNYILIGKEAFRALLVEEGVTVETEEQFDSLYLECESMINRLL